jgi:hypothetical protein
MTFMSPEPRRDHRRQTTSYATCQVAYVAQLTLRWENEGPASSSSGHWGRRQLSSSFAARCGCVLPPICCRVGFECEAAAARPRPEPRPESQPQRASDRRRCQTGAPSVRFDLLAKAAAFSAGGDGGRRSPEYVQKFTSKNYLLGSGCGRTSACHRRHSTPPRRRRCKTARPFASRNASSSCSFPTTTNDMRSDPAPYQCGIPRQQGPEPERHAPHVVQAPVYGQNTSPCPST